MSLPKSKGNPNLKKKKFNIDKTVIKMNLKSRFLVPSTSYP